MAGARPEAERIVRWLEGLPAERRDALAASLAAEVERDGLTVYRADEDRFLPIPVVLTPEPLDRAAFDALGADARRLLSAAIKLARFALGPHGGSIAGRLFSAFTPLELEAIRRDPARLERVATARVDCFYDAEGRPRALELNATIPAMQGYADILAHRWVRTIARARGFEEATIDRLVAETGSNTADLLASLVEHYRRAGGRAERPSILVVSRRGDAQLGELHHYVRAFSAAGHRTMHAFADEVDVDAAGRLGARGERFDLLYRHVFARRVDPASPLGRLLIDPGPNVILNPVVSPLEVKGMLDFLHRAPSDAALAARLGLDDDELAALARLVPWTRLLSTGSSTLPDGSRVDDLAAWVAQHPERLVLKKSWDYGGKGVVLGPDAADWRGAVAAALADPHAWVVQEYVPPRAERHLLVERDAAGRVTARARHLFVDVSAYVNHGVATHPRGGACRASGSKIVNILGGGGLTPLVPTSVLAALAP